MTVSSWVRGPWQPWARNIPFFFIWTSIILQVGCFSYRPDLVFIKSRSLLITSKESQCEFFRLVVIGVQLLCRAALVSPVQQSESTRHTPLFLGFPFHWVTTEHSVAFPELCSRFSLVISFIRSSIVYICQSQSPSSPHPSSRLGVHPFVLLVL